jgi:methionyl-tRNA synthetase
MTKQNFYITTAIAYVNGLPHLGHAYEAILTDVMARFQRLDGKDVMFLTGTDEHGEKVAKTAEKNGVAPKAFADVNAAAFEAMDKTLNISHDDFIRTTEPRHYAASQALWKKLQERGDIYLGKYEGWYSVREEGYFTEAELTKNDKGQMITPNGTEAEWVVEPSYFFKLSAYTDRLLKLYESNPEFIQPKTRRNEIISFVAQEGGLRDISVSRHKSRLSWGIPVPGDEDHVMYVWLDALTNYITAPGYPDENAANFKKYWPADFHVIGKDIIRFHAIYWPAFLMSANIALPKTIFAHGFINVQGEKMSKSIGNVLSPDDLVNAFGLDQIRYFLMREIPHGEDGNFSPEQAIQRINADLANSLGNLVQRTLSFIYKNCNAEIPTPGEFNVDDHLLWRLTHKNLLEIVRSEFNSFKINRAIESILGHVNSANVYIDLQAPWKLKKEDTNRMNTVLYVLTDVIRCLAILMQPYTPGSAEKMLDQLKIPTDERSFAHLDAKYAIKPGTIIDQPVGIFPRLENKEEAA